MRPGRAAARARYAGRVRRANGCRCCSSGGWWSPWVPPWAHRTGYGDRWRRALGVEAIWPSAEHGVVGTVGRVAATWRTSRGRGPPSRQVWAAREVARRAVQSTDPLPYHPSKTKPSLDAVPIQGGLARERRVAVGIIAWIVLGAIAGWITNLIMGGKEGVIATIILGIVGAVVGGFLAGTVLKVADVTGINIQSIVVAVMGAVIVVAAYRFFMGRRAAV